MRSNSSEPQIHCGISSATPVWSPSVHPHPHHHPAYDFDMYATQLNGNLGSSCCLGSTNGNSSLSHSHLSSQVSNSYSSYYTPGSATPHDSSSSAAAAAAAMAAASRQCKPAPSKFWSNSYDTVNSASPQMPSDPIVAAAVCHGSAFAAAAAHHAAANHVAAAASAWCGYPPYHQATRSESYLTDPDPRSFVDSATYAAHHPAMRISSASDQSCASAATSVASWTQPTNGVPSSSTTTSTSECTLTLVNTPLLPLPVE